MKSAIDNKVKRQDIGVSEECVHGFWFRRCGPSRVFSIVTRHVSERLVTRSRKQYALFTGACDQSLAYVSGYDFSPL